MNKHPVVLALDLSIARTGFAICDLDGVTSGAQSFEVTKGQHPAMRFYRFRLWLDQMLLSHKPDIVLYEKSSSQSMASNHVIYCAVALNSRLDEACAVAGIPLKEVMPNALKRAYAYDGNAWKFEMQGRAAMDFPHYDADKDEGADEADALALVWCFHNAPQVFEPKVGKKAKRMAKKAA